MTEKRFPSYSEYKDSGIEWLGEIPVHWEVTRLKLVSRLHTGGTPAGLAGDAFDESGIPWVKPDDLLGDRGMRQPEKAVAPEAARGIGAVPKGSALICGIGTVGKFGYALSEVCTNQQINSAVFGKRFVPRFGQFVVWGLQSEFESHSNKVTIAICNKASMGLARLAIPPRAEQEAIAEFLDRETAKIDALVEKKERLIELLQEKRTALITQAVTKGLDPNVPMRDSGIEWLGQIPAHWEVCQLRRVIQRFVDYRGKTPKKTPSGVPLVTARNIKNQTIDFSLSEEFIPEDLYDKWMVRGLPREGDVLITTEAPLGETAQIQDPDIALAQRIILLKQDRSRISSDYLKYHFVSDFGRSELQTRATGSTALGIKASHLRAAQVALPLLREQEAIASFLDRETAKIDALIAKIQEAIERLKEYRTALISAAVTGKIDVRGLVENRKAGTE